LLPRMAKRSDSPIRSPVLWSLRPVSFCPLHRQPLQERCPWCNRGSRPLASFTRPGHCSRCKRWLGVRSRDEASESALDQHQMRHASLGSDRPGELLEATPRVPEGLMRAAFRENLRGLVDRFAAGNATAFAQGLSISYSILDGWLNGKSAASLDGLLQLSENLNIAPINLITPGSALRNVRCEADRKTDARWSWTSSAVP